MNFIPVKVEENSEGIYLKFYEESIKLTMEKADLIKANGYVGKEVVMGIRPENLDNNIEFVNDHKNSVIDAIVDVIEIMGAETVIYLSKGTTSMTVRVNGTSLVKVGDKIKVAMEESKLHLFDKETELAIF